MKNSTDTVQTYIFQVTMCLTGGPWQFVITLIFRNKLQQGEVRHANQFRSMLGFWEFPVRPWFGNGNGSDVGILP
jgi:hypothetical protein